MKYTKDQSLIYEAYKQAVAQHAGEGLNSDTLARLILADEACEESNQRFVEDLIDSKGRFEITERDLSRIQKNLQTEVRYQINEALQQLDFRAVALELSKATMQRLKSEYGARR